MAGAIQIQGLRELREALKQVSVDAPKQLARTNQAVGEIVAEEARRLAPRGAHQGGGAVMPIADSIHSSRSGLSVAVIAGGARSPHAAVTEFGGTIPRRGGGGRGRRRASRAAGSVTRVRQQAYLLPAVAAKTAQIESEYLGMIDGLLEEFTA